MVVICIDTYRFGSSCPNVLFDICTCSLRGGHGDTSPSFYRVRDDMRLDGQTHSCKSEKHSRRQVFTSSRTTYKTITRYNMIQLHDTIRYNYTIQHDTITRLQHDTITRYNNHLCAVETRMLNNFSSRRTTN